MRTTIDRAGRIVIPKALRERMGWKGEAEVDVYEAPDGTVAIAPVVDDRPHLVTTADGWTVLENLGAPVTDADVRAALDESRR